MNALIVTGLIAVGVVITLLVVAALPQRRPHNLTKDEVADEIEAFLNASGSAHDWSDFCSFTIADPELDEIRARCAQLREEFPPDPSGGYCNEAGIKVLRGYVANLRHPVR
ncbi:MAG TPA: hypothetical protein VIQ24_04925 [Pyrinomonadaceae bacterium]